MTLLDQTITALIAYRKRNGYTRTIGLCEHGNQHQACTLCATDLPF